MKMKLELKTEIKKIAICLAVGMMMCTVGSINVKASNDNIQFKGFLLKAHHANSYTKARYR